MSYHVNDYSALDGGQIESYANGLQLSGYFDGTVGGQDYSLLQSILVDGGSHFGVSTLSFDSFEELLWMGNQGGHMTSYSNADLQKHTSFQVHVSNEIFSILPHDVGILSLTSNSLRMSSRRGLPMFYHCSEQVQNMQCMVLTPVGTLLMGGHHNNLIELDLNTIEEINVVQLESDNCAILRKHPRFICSGDISGKVFLHDPNTLQVQETIKCHTGMLSDFDVHGNLLVTCGFSAGRHGDLSVERFLKVYDLRVMKSMNPISMLFPPLLLRFMPAYSSRLCAVSQNGQFQMIDTDSSEKYASFIHQVENGGADIITFDLSSSCQAFAFGDATGYLHLFGASNEVQFNQFSRPTEFADSVEPLTPIDINDEVTPLSTIPLPHSESKLLSDWPEELTQVAYRPTPPIDPLILNSMKMVGSIGYAPNPGNRRRNQVPYPLNQNKQSQDSPVPKDDGQELVPQRYLKQEIKYTKMGLDDIDFNRFNRTSFCGLEANLPNSYCNNLIQILYFIEPLRSALLNHLCQREFCLACELGFLFHMLDTAQGLPCQASNFLRAFRTIPEASAHGLIVNDLSEPKKKEKLPILVQSWTRFMLQQLHTETLEIQPEENSSDCQSVMTSLFGAKLFSCNSCRCRTETLQESTTFLTQLVYPTTQGQNKDFQHSFIDILQRSLNVKQYITAWCENCSRFTNIIQTRILKSLPDILVLNCCEKKQEVEFLRKQFQIMTTSSDATIMKTLPDVPIRRKSCRYGALCKRTDCRYYHEHKNTEKSEDLNKCSASWIPLGLRLILKGGEITAKEIGEKMDNEEAESEGNVESAVYELTAVVSVIMDIQENGRDNIVSCIKIGPHAHMRHKGGAAYQWYLFNDFSIVPITAQEAVYLNFDWKIPCVLIFSRTDLNNRHSLDVFNPVEKQVFREDVSLAARSGQSHITFTPLSFEEGESPAGGLVAMDAEFVTLNQEEAEIRSDGTRSTIRPSQLSVARISCVRGDGPLEGVPFIDDYISTQEQVVDYLTKFSGIQPGDLDASISSKHLTTLKATYQKLRFLIDSGVIFVGHGLKNDFRVINLVVPPAQVLDTVYLFQLPNKRMISLRFLAWHFLGLKIQAETHDSIEDAKTALQLYKKYLELEQTGKIKEALKELYDVGRQLQWKVPGIDD